MRVCTIIIIMIEAHRYLFLVRQMDVRTYCQTDGCTYILSDRWMYVHTVRQTAAIA